MNLTERQKEIIVNYLLSITGRTKEMAENFVVMREEIQAIIDIMRSK